MPQLITLAAPYFGTTSFVCDPLDLSSDVAEIGDNDPTKLNPMDLVTLGTWVDIPVRVFAGKILGFADLSDEQAGSLVVQELALDIRDA